VPASTETAFTRHVGIEVPLICGAMYPCTTPELVAAVSGAGGIGIVQPISFVYVHKLDYREGLRRIRKLTDKPIGVNAIVEKSSRVYLDRMMRWVDESLEEGVRFFITALGNPQEVVRRVEAAGGVVYHDVTERKWAQKAIDAGVHGLICVNSRAGGHAGSKSPEQLFEEMGDLGVPLVCAGGVGGPEAFVRALDIGYAAVQMGTRFIATPECHAHDDYKQAILRAEEQDIVLTERITGVPVSVIKTPYIEKIGTDAGFVGRRLLRHPRTKHLMRSFYSLMSVWKLKQSYWKGTSYKDYFQAGKSVADVREIEPAADIVRRFAGALAEARPASAG
jgi:nitronate monooxygenase